VATYSVRFLRDGTAAAGLEVVAVGERFFGTTNASGVISANLGTYSNPVGVHLIVTGSGINWGGGPMRLEPNGTKDVNL
jgi:hypothetical protein